MGRKTWDSLPPRFRPLPGRRNIVVTRQADWQADGAERAASLRRGARAVRTRRRAEVWVIGGAQIYAAGRAAGPARRRDRDRRATSRATPGHRAFGAGWHETARESHVAANGLPFSFVTLERR